MRGVIRGGERRRGSGRRAGFAAVLSLIASLILFAPGAEAAGKPRLTKAGIACAKGEQGQFCLLYIRAKGTREVEFSLGRGHRLSEAAYNGRDIFGARSWYRNPVRKGCLRVRARARSKRGTDRGVVRLCDVGYGPATSPIETAWSYADYRHF